MDIESLSKKNPFENEDFGNITFTEDYVPHERDTIKNSPNDFSLLTQQRSPHIFLNNKL